MMSRAISSGGNQAGQGVLRMNKLGSCYKNVVCPLLFDWKEGGAYRVALHTAVGGLTGNVEGALGAGVSAASVPEIAKMVNELDVPEGLKQTLIASAGTAVGAAVGGASGATTAANQTINNCLAHGRYCFDLYNEPLPDNFDPEKLYAVQPTVGEYAEHFEGGTKEDVYRMGSDVDISNYYGSSLVKNSDGEFTITPSPLAHVASLIAWGYTDYSGPMADSFLYGSLNHIKVLPNGDYHIPSDRFNFDTYENVWTNGRDFMTYVQWIAVTQGAPKENAFTTHFIGPIKKP